MKIIKILFISILLIFTLGSTALWLTGNDHLFFAIPNTILKGRWGPDIDEYKIYHNREVVNSSYAEPWPENFSKLQLTEEELAYHRDLQTAAFLVIKNDSIVFEYYDETHSDSSLTNSWSMAKSILSTAIGIAIDEGYIKDVNVLLSDFFPQYEGSGITLAHLLSMSSGINFVEDYNDPFGHQAKALYGNDLKKLNDHYVPVRTPGEVFDYEGGNSILLGMVLEKAIGTTISDYVSKKIWTPIHAEHTALWSLDHEDGLERVFCCFNSNARDFARLGKLMEHDGIWDGDTVISPSYVHMATNPAPTKLSSGGDNDRYGYHWWVLRLPEYYGFYARGFQGQYIVVLPNEGLIVVRLGKKWGKSDKKGHSEDMLNYVNMARRMTQ